MSQGREASDREVIFAFDQPLQERAGFLVLQRQSVRLRDHEDQRDLRGVPPALPVAARRARACSRRARSCSTAPTTITTASTTPRSTSTSTASWSSAARARSAGRARPKSSTCSRPTLCCSAASSSLPTLGDGRQSGTSDSPSILNASPESAAGGGLPGCAPATSSASTSTRAPATRWSTRRDRPPPGGRTAAGPGQQHAVGGALPREDRAARRRGRARVRGEISRHLREDPAAQPLGTRPCLPSEPPKARSWLSPPRRWAPSSNGTTSISTACSLRSSPSNSSPASTRPPASSSRSPRSRRASRFGRSEPFVFGRLGDLVGRKNTFLVTMAIMGLSTFLVGLLPSYASIGVAAPVLLVGLRLMQGLALGGEYGGAATYVAEHAPQGNAAASTPASSRPPRRWACSPRCWWSSARGPRSAKKPSRSGAGACPS